ncbi:isochorismate synthase [[Leptolyngbya] sp. PCC 7376]|uniref:isochorismate synthase n=1 Tax=[Leptolyngbya] sp. PCC 7376 TaxID=111781 RepID=UPI00029F35EB|nr:isochorismate synthase [[Leptolyngbya] sp. PCC 7376]AFY39778.1 isochorismate synthase [[Leptolyngbya] sp. PCC 7376]
MGKTLWRDHLDPNHGSGLATVGNSPTVYQSRQQISQPEWQKFLTTPASIRQDEIFSEVLPIQPVDLLQVLRGVERKVNIQLNHFYWEQRTQTKAILGLGVLRELILDGDRRFQIAQDFIEQCQRNLHHTLDVAIPYFDCGFTFFAHQQPNSPFPAAQISIPRIQIFQLDQQYFLVVNGDHRHRSMLARIAKQVKRFIENLPTLKLSGKKASQVIMHSSSHSFVGGVKNALQLIEQGDLSKVVLAHALDVTAEKPFDIVNALDNLRDRHPDCCVFSRRNLRGDTFIGASPERLLAIQDGKLLTDALAGSAPRGTTDEADYAFAHNLLHSEKERREHQAVANFLIEQLQDLKLQPQVAERTLLKLSNIQHLWTPITANLPEHIHPLEIVAKLHPTPAVAGVPRVIACDHIRQAEPFDRNLYAAPIGWLDSHGNAEFIVAIRSALIRGKHARLYGGAGIVAGSQPEREYAEVQLKLTSLLNALT